MSERTFPAAAAIALLIGLVALLVWPLWSDRPTPAESATSTGTAAPATAVRMQGSAVPTQRTAIEPLADESPRSTRVTGRCLAAEDQSPLAGCAIELLASNVAIVKTISAADGTFALSGTDSSYRLRVTAESRIPYVQARTSPPGSQDHAWGDLLLARAVAVRGQVRDPMRQPVPHCLVSFEHRELTVPIGTTSGPDHATRSGSDGRYELPAPLSAGTWDVRVLHEGWVLEEPRQLTIAGDLSELEVDILLRRANEIRGVTVDEQGQPVPDVRLSARDDPGSAGRGFRSDAHGNFVIQGDGRGATHVMILPRSGLSRPHEPIGEYRRIPWGTEDLRIVVRTNRVGTLEVRAVEGALREPVPRFEATFSIGIPPNVGYGNTSMPTTTGAACLPFPVNVGAQCQVFVVADDATLRPASVGPFRIESEQPTIVEVPLERLQPAMARVVDRDAQPIQGATVELAEAGAGRIGRQGIDGRPLHWRRGEKMYFGDPGQRHSLCLSHAISDSEGLAKLHRPASDEGLVLLASAAGHLPIRIEPPFDWPVDGEIRFTLAPAARLHGRVHGLDPAWQAMLWLTPVAVSAGPSKRLEHPLPADGQFAFETLAPGTWQPAVGVRANPRGRSELNLEFVPLELPIAPIRVTAGAKSELTIDAGAQRAAILRGRMTLDGRPVETGELHANHLRSQSDGDLHPLWVGSAAIGSGGSFAFRSLPPGRCRLTLIQPGPAGSWRRIDADDDLHLSSSRALDRPVDFPRRTMHVLLLDQESRQPIRSTRLWLGSAEATTDDNGRITFDWIQQPSGWIGHGNDRLREYRFAPGGGDLQVELTIRR